MTGIDGRRLASVPGRSTRRGPQHPAPKLASSRKRRVVAGVVTIVIGVAGLFLLDQAFQRDPGEPRTLGFDPNVSLLIVSVLTDSRADADFQLIEMRPDGSGRTELTFGGEGLTSRTDLQPSVSSDRRDGCVHPGCSALRGRSHGRPARAIVRGGSIDDVAWSPDGTRLAVGGSISNDSPFGLYVMNADGSDPHLVQLGGGIDLASPA